MIMSVLRREHCENQRATDEEREVTPLSVSAINRLVTPDDAKQKDRRKQIRAAFKKYLLPPRAGERVYGYKKYEAYCLNPQALKRWIQRYGTESVSDELVSKELNSSLRAAQSQSDSGPCDKCEETGSWRADFDLFICDECYAELTTGQIPQLHEERDGQADVGKISQKFAQE